MYVDINNYKNIDNNKYYIYKITSCNNKVYIGQTTNIHIRFKSYKGIQCKGQIHLYNSLKKYGINNHKFEILQVFPNDVDINILNEYEFFYIKILRQAKTNLLNIRDGGLNTKLSEITKKKISEARKGKYLGIDNPMYGKTHTLEVRKILSDKKKGSEISDYNRKQLNKSVCKPILQFDLNNNLIKEWNSATEVQKELGFNSRVINAQARGLRKQAYQYIWKYKI